MVADASKFGRRSLSVIGDRDSSRGHDNYQYVTLRGLDSLYSIVQMPRGFPVGTLAIGRPGASNAALLATGILALSDQALADRLDEWREGVSRSVPFAPE